MFEISVDLLACDSPWKAAAGRRKRLRWATPSWLIDGSEMFGQFGRSIWSIAENDDEIGG